MIHWPNKTLGEKESQIYEYVRRNLEDNSEKVNKINYKEGF